MRSDQFVPESSLDIASLRESYTQAELLESTIHCDPYQQFQTWFAEAVNAKLPEPNAMTLATVSQDGKPAARIVLLKELSVNGFVFYTNFQSRKGQDLQQHPHAALVFWWAALERQVRIEGSITQVADTVSDRYFQSRPLGSQLGAWASRQSEVVPDRAALEQQLAALAQQYEGKPIPRPPFWGGFCLQPTYFEFWQGRPNRLHDRLCYRQNKPDGWLIQRLSP